MFLFAILIASFVAIKVDAKIYDRCELARELVEVHEIPEKQLATWVCIARHESEFDTAAQNLGSGDHGLFQISQLFWCSPTGYACGVSCKDLRDDDIEDDVICARRIYREHKRLSGDGFNAWVVYHQFCKNKEYADSFLDGCFDKKQLNANKTSKDRPLPTINYYPQFTRKTTKPTTTTKLTTTTLPTTSTAFNYVDFFNTLKPLKTRLFAGEFSTFGNSETTTADKDNFYFTNGVNFNSYSGEATRVQSTTRKFNNNNSNTKGKISTTTAKSGVVNFLSQPKNLKPIEDNQDFVFSISKTGYNFRRKP